MRTYRLPLGRWVNRDCAPPVTNRPYPETNRSSGAGSSAVNAHLRGIIKNDI